MRLGSTHVAIAWLHGSWIRAISLTIAVLLALNLGEAREGKRNGDYVG